MTANREEIAQALLATLKSAPGGFITIGRRHVAPPMLTPAQQPALFAAQTAETVTKPDIGAPAVTTIETNLFIYCLGPGTDGPAGDEQVLAETTLNGLLDDVDAALAADETGRQTLGGLVHDCWVEGDVAKDPGLLTQQAMAVIPVRILVP